MNSRVAIIAALSRELRPLVGNWKLERDADGVSVYSSAGSVAVFAGMGAERARLAAEAALEFGPVSRIVSAGWAGGLHAGMVPGGVWRVRAVVNASNGEVFETRGAGGKREFGSVLVTVGRVASAADKRALRELYSADLVDMEAAAVAEVAWSNKVPFSALKAVSDGPELDLPGMERFATSDGGFREGAFAAYVALRPALWSPAVRLARNSAAAAESLCRELERQLAEDELGAA